MAIIVQDGPSKARGSIIGVRRRTLRIKFVNIRNKGSGGVNGCAGRTIEGTKVCHRGSSREIWTKNEK